IRAVRGDRRASVAGAARLPAAARARPARLAGGAPRGLGGGRAAGVAGATAGRLMVDKDERRLRVGGLGCGPIAPFAPFEGCGKARNAELHALCDVAEDLVTRMAQIHRPAKTYLRYDDMLADPDVEAVIVATADAFHVAAAARALEAGKHVLCEKPLGVSVEE